MASSEKKPRTTIDLNEETSAVGYIHSVSPMKTSVKGNPYFNAKIQEANKITSVVGYNEKMHTDLMRIEEQRTPVKFTNISRTPSYREPGSFDIKLIPGKSQLSPALKVNFSFEKPDISESSPLTKINNLKDVAEGSRVTVIAKVLRREETVPQVMKNNQMMNRTSFIIADESGSIELTLWGPAEQLLENNSYSFTNVTVKTFQKKKLSTNSETSIKKVANLKTVLDSSIFKSTPQVMEVKGVTIQSVQKCCFCNNLLEINASLSSVKCQKCLRRQLNESVVKSTRCEITVHKSGQPAETQIFVPSALLTQFTGDIPNDDKELFILMCKKIEVVLASDTSSVVTSIKKAK